MKGGDEQPSSPSPRQGGCVPREVLPIDLCFSSSTLSSLCLWISSANFCAFRAFLMAFLRTWIESLRNSAAFVLSDPPAPR